MADTVRIGSEEHKRLFCQMFIDTHDPFLPSGIAWPELDADTLVRLKALPVWSEAARTEAATAVKVQALGRAETDALLARAISLQGYEEARHAEVIERLTRRYGIAVEPYPEPREPRNPTWTFLRTGYGECLDSFFAFGFFAIGGRSALFPEKLIEIFGTIMQEEARHILFIVNWAAYLRARRPLPLRPVFDARRAWNIVAQAFGRVRGAMAMKGANSQGGFALKSHASFGDFSLRSFLELCLSENERRFASYDRRLLRPTLVPATVRLLLKILPAAPRPAGPATKPRRAGDLDSSGGLE